MLTSLIFFTATCSPQYSPLYTCPKLLFLANPSEKEREKRSALLPSRAKKGLLFLLVCDVLKFHQKRGWEVREGNVGGQRAQADRNLPIQLVIFAVDTAAVMDDSLLALLQCEEVRMRQAQRQAMGGARDVNFYFVTAIPPLKEGVDHVGHLAQQSSVYHLFLGGHVPTFFFFPSFLPLVGWAHLLVEKK